MTADGWRDELTAIVRLYAGGRATGDDVFAFAARVWDVEGDASESQGVFVVRQLLCVAGQATVDEDQAVFDATRELIDLCPEADRQANSAGQFLTAFANVRQSGAAVQDCL